jgi:hypothetical protein
VRTVGTFFFLPPFSSLFKFFYLLRFEFVLITTSYTEHCTRFRRAKAEHGCPPTQRT